MLTIFWETGTLRALLDFPVRMNAGGLTYFLRAPWQIYNPENFLSTIVFGTVGGRIENSTLKFMENMYAPIAFHSDEWPAGIIFLVCFLRFTAKFNSKIRCVHFCFLLVILCLQDSRIFVLFTLARLNNFVKITGYKIMHQLCSKEGQMNFLSTKFIFFSFFFHQCQTLIRSLSSPYRGDSYPETFPIGYFSSKRLYSSIRVI